MQKVSKYIHVRSSISCGPGDGRRVLLSLPRVRWLERQPDYTPWPPLETPLPKPEIKGEQINTRRHLFRPQLRSDELTQRQRQAWALHIGGHSHAEIGERMCCSVNAASKLIGQAREKLGVGLK